MARVYLETSFVSACVTDRTDVPSSYRRQVSREWWETQAPRHELWVSQEVLDELSVSSYRRREAALQWITTVPLLEITEAVIGLAHVLVRERAMPSPVRGDAIHLAVAAVYDVEVLVSWNVRHLANINKRMHLRRVCSRCGYTAPEIVTPDVFWEIQP